jgi:1,4-dihydroxy-6-naphthoate synthase
LREIRIGYSPCPNDTFVFAHLEKVARDLKFVPVLADIETLNEWAIEARLEVTKVSTFALGKVLDHYGLLHSGSALGRGCGPIVVGRKGTDPARLATAKVASPGRWTTASLLLSLYLGKSPDFTYMEFSKVMESVAKGDVEFGLLIHEGRFVFQSWGLELILDLGEWWEEKTQLPLSLGNMVIKRELPKALARKVDRAIKASLELSLSLKPGTMEYVMAHAQEMSRDVVMSHIQLYVTEFTRDLGQQGVKAIEKVLEMARKVGLVGDFSGPLFHD